MTEQVSEQAEGPIVEKKIHIYEDADLRKIAVDLYNNHIFTIQQIEQESLIPMVFMPIALGGLQNIPKEDLERIGSIFEYYSEAGPRGINGYPIFFSCKLISKEQWDQVKVYFDEYKELQNKFVKTSDQKQEN